MYNPLILGEYKISLSAGIRIPVAQPERLKYGFCGQIFLRLLSGHIHVTTLRWRLSSYDGYDRRFEKIEPFLFAVAVTADYVTGSRPQSALLLTASTQLFR
jgi:hypothetical protein